MKLLCLILMLVLPTFANASEIDEFFNFLKVNNVSTQLEFFEAVSKDDHYSALLNDPVLTPVSFALHKDDVSAKFPRMLMRMKNMIIMMTGDSQKLSSNILEVITFDPQKKIYLFSLVNFRAKIPENKFIRDASRFDFKSLLETDPSFEKIFNCATCHAFENGTELRPRWGLPPFYQVPFGQNQDTIFAGSQQMKAWEEFQGTLKDKTSVTPYQFLKIATEIDSDGNVILIKHPNLSMAGQIKEQNLSRLARIIKSSPNYSKLKFFIISLCLGNPQPESFFDSKTWKVFSSEFKNLIPSQTRNREEKELLQISDELLLTRLKEIAIAKNHYSLEMVLTRGSVDGSEQRDFTGVLLENQNASRLSLNEIMDLLLGGDRETSDRLAILRLLLDYRASEKVESWSTHVPFPFGSSYRFSSDFLVRLAKEKLLPELLEKYPHLKLVTDKDELFQKLKAMSRLE